MSLESTVENRLFLTQKNADYLFLGATKHLYNWLCPLFSWSVGRSVGWLVTHSFDNPHVAPYWPTGPCLAIFLYKHAKAYQNTQTYMIEDTKYCLLRSPCTNGMFSGHTSIKIIAQLSSFRKEFVAITDFLDPVSV